MSARCVVRPCVSTTSFYRHYGGVDGVLLAIFDKVWVDIEARMASGESPMEEAVLGYRYVRDNAEMLRLY